MDGDGIGGLQLVGGALEIVDHVLVVNADVDGPAGLVNLRDDAHVPVEHALPGGAVLLGPGEVVVVAYLHHLVPQAEQGAVYFDLRLAPGGGVDGLPQVLVQLHGAQLPLAAGAQHLDVRDAGIAVAAGQAHAAQGDNQLGGLLGVLLGQEEEVAVVAAQVGQFALHNAVGAHDDEALLGLAENLLELHRGEQAGGNQIPQDVARPHAGQLVVIPHQNQPAGEGQGPQQALKDVGVHHGELVHHKAVALQGVALVAGEHGVVLLVPVHLKQAVDGLGLLAGDLAHALGGAAGGGRQEHPLPRLLEQADDGV